MPILHAPILEQAGFSIGGVAPEPAINYVARLEPVAGQYWQLSEPIPINEGYEIYFTFVNNGYQSSSYLLCSNDNTDTGLFTNPSDGRLLTSGNTSITIDVDGMGNNVETYDGLPHEITIEVLGGGSFQKLASRFNGVRTLSGWIKSLVVRDELGNVVNEIPLTNKEQGATQLATVGDVNAFMPNYSSDVWEVAP